MRTKIKCNKCGIGFDHYWLKDGVCNGCRNPHLIVRSIPSVEFRILSTNNQTNELEIEFETGLMVYLKLRPNESINALDALQLNNIIRSRVLGQEIGE